MADRASFEDLIANGLAESVDVVGCDQVWIVTENGRRRLAGLFDDGDVRETLRAMIARGAGS